MFGDCLEVYTETLDLEAGGILRREEYQDGSLIVKITGQEPFALDTLAEIDQRVERAREIAKRARFPKPEYTREGFKTTVAAIIKNGLHTLLTPFVMDARNLALSEMNSVEDLLTQPFQPGQDLDDLVGEPKVVAFFHGYSQFPGAGAQFMSDAAQQGLLGLSIGYDYTMAPEDFSERVLLPLIDAITKAGGLFCGAVGHSTGADNLRYAVLHDSGVQDYAREYGTRFVFSAPITTGMENPPTPTQRNLLSLFPREDNVNTTEGKYKFAKINHPVPKGIDAYTLLCQDDLLVPPECGIDTNNRAINVMIPGGGHFLGSGIGTYVNNAALYLITNGVPDPK